MNDKNRDIFSGNKGEAVRPDSKMERVAVTAFLLYFAVKAFYFAFSIGENIFPDEMTWFGISEVFSRYFFPPVDSAETYRLGLVTRVPVLYFYLMGKCISMNVFPVSDLVFLRCINVCISIVTVWFGWKLVRMLVPGTVVRLLFLAMITNTMMFTFVSASVSYDNLTNCLAVLALYYLFSFLKFRGAYNFLLFILFACMGMLTKITFLPYAFVLLAVLLFCERQNIRFLPSAAVSLFSPLKWKNCLLLILCLFFITVNVNLYLGNMIKYGKLRPGMDKVVGLEQAMQFRLFARSYIVRLFREGKISYAEAKKMPFIYIRNPGDRADTLSLIESAAREKAWNRKMRIDRFRYAFSWTDVVMLRTFGIAGHKVMQKRGSGLIPYYLILLAAGILMIRRMKTSDMEGTALYLLGIAGAYILILMQQVNYNIYYKSGAMGLALTGRYIFPVLVPIYALAAYYLAGFGPKKWQWVIFLVVAAVFVYGEFPWFLQRVSPDWFFR